MLLCSMGGAVAVHTAVQDYLPSLAGLVVIDVVEGEFHWTYCNRGRAHASTVRQRGDSCRSQQRNSCLPVPWDGRVTTALLPHEVVYRETVITLP